MVMMPFQQYLSYTHTQIATSKKIYKTRRASLSLYEEIENLRNCMNLPRSEDDSKRADSPILRHSDMFHKVEFAADEQSQFCEMIGDYLNQQIQVNDSCQVRTVPVHFVLDNV
jgi:hypothetical protein